MPGVGTLTSPLRHLSIALPVAALLGACSAEVGHDPSTFAIPNATAAPIRMDICKPGTFIGTMTVNCPQVAK